MVSSLRSANLLSDYLAKLDPDAPPHQKGRKFMEEKLGMYFWWKTSLSKSARSGHPTIPMPATLRSGRAPAENENDGLSEALKKKDKDRLDKAANRRRVRGGAPAAAAESTRGKGKAADTIMTLGEEAMREEAETIAQ